MVTWEPQCHLKLVFQDKRWSYKKSTLTWEACGRCRLFRRCLWGTVACSPVQHGGPSDGTSDTPWNVSRNQQSALQCEWYQGPPLRGTKRGQWKSNIVKLFSTEFLVFKSKQKKNKKQKHLVLMPLYLGEFHLVTQDLPGRRLFPWQHWPPSVPPPVACTPPSV